jgi:hypothetical protein
VRFSRPARRPLGHPRHPGDRRSNVRIYKHETAPSPARGSPPLPAPMREHDRSTPATNAPRHRKKRCPPYKISQRSYAPHPPGRALPFDPIRAAIDTDERTHRRRCARSSTHSGRSPAPSPPMRRNSREPKTTARVREDLTRAVAQAGPEANRVATLRSPRRSRTCSPWPSHRPRRSNAATRCGA